MELNKQKPRVWVIHENKQWTLPLENELDKLLVSRGDWFINHINFNLGSEPPEGIFYNRMSASSHTRGHDYAPDAALSVLAWLDAHERIVINPYQALRLELSKAEQYTALNRFGIQTPISFLANSKNQILEAASHFEEKEFILKPNRGGKGTGVKKFGSLTQLRQWLSSDEFENSPDGINLVQEYIKPADNSIKRMEFVGGKFLYTVSVDSSQGFELCPADECDSNAAFCPAEQSANTENNRFSIIENYSDSKIGLYESFLSKMKLDIAAIEYVENEKGERFVYDINTNTNYNEAAEASFSEQKKGMESIAIYLKNEFEKLFILEGNPVKV